MSTRQGPECIPASRELCDAGKPHLVPEAIHAFDEVGFFELPRPVVGGPVIAHAIELARVQVPADAVGVVTTIWQYLESPVGPLYGPLEAQRLGGRVTLGWSVCREDPTPEIRGGELRRLAGGELPRGRIPPYGVFSDLRFLWGGHAPVKVFVPERSTLSLWVRVTAPVGEIRQVGGRLAGYTQSGKSQHTVSNLVEGL